MTAETLSARRGKPFSGHPPQAGLIISTTGSLSTHFANVFLPGFESKTRQSADWQTVQFSAKMLKMIRFGDSGHPLHCGAIRNPAIRPPRRM